MIPKTSESRARAVFDAAELTTRKINPELRWLIYEQGARMPTVQNPARSTRSAWRSSPAAGSVRGQPRLLRLRAHRRAGGRDHRGGRLVGLENIMSGGSSSTTTPARSPARRCAGDLVVKGDVGARTGIDQKGGTIVTLGNAELDERRSGSSSAPPR